jgi:N-acetylmuramate 1-kinase
VDYPSIPQFLPVLEEIESIVGRSGDGLQFHPLVGDGSDRKFYRIRSGARHFILLTSPRSKSEGIDENDSYYSIGTHLFRVGVPVPEFLWADPGRGLFLMEDLGDFHLQRHVQRKSVNVRSTYRRVLRLLVHMHREAPCGFNSSQFCFDTPLYEPSFVYVRELEYFRKAFLVNYLGLEVGEEDLKPDFENIAEASGRFDPRLIMHRDFQSRNIMVSKGRLRLVDFQGMRHGPPLYDLASLLLDPYVKLSSKVQEELVELYWSAASDFLGCSHREFRSSYAVLRLCRNLQILGAFGFLGLVKGKRQFLSYIPAAWRQLLVWMNGPLSGRYPKLQQLLNSNARIIPRTEAAAV